MDLAFWKPKPDRPDDPESVVSAAVGQMIEARMSAVRSRFTARRAYLKSMAALTDSREDAKAYQSKLEEAELLSGLLEESS